MSSFMPACSQCEKAALMASCSHFALLWIVTPSAAVTGMEGRCSFAALFSIGRSSQSAAQMELLSDQWIYCPSTLSWNLCCQGPENQMEEHLYSILPVLCVARLFSFEIQVYSTNKPHKLTVVRSLTCVAFILVHSAFVRGVNRVILRMHQRLRTVWDLYYVKFTQHEAERKFSLLLSSV